MDGNIKPGRIEIKTLAQAVGEEADAALAALLNDGWELLCEPSVTTLPDYMHIVRHFEVIKLMRLVEVDDQFIESGEMVAAVEAVNLTPDPSPKGEGSKEETTELPKVVAGAESIPEPIRVVHGTAFGVDLVGEIIDETTERESMETVTFAAALVSGKYSPAEMSQIGNREALAAGMNAVWKRQQYGGRSWESLINRLPALVNP
jgi:hypothetical protein